MLKVFSSELNQLLKKILKKIKDYIYLEQVGYVSIYTSNIAKHARISINFKNQISLIIPLSYPEESAIDFLISKKSWIKKTIFNLRGKKRLKFDLNEIEKRKFWNKTIKMVNSLSEKNNLLFKKVIFKTLKSRWGSCSFENIICLNNLLFYLPRHLQEYIILHELVHVKVKDHSKKFWCELEKVCSDAKRKNKELASGYRLQ